MTVGVLDTGVDASNPDIAPNFSCGAVPQLRARTSPTSTGPARWRAASTRSAPTTAATAPTSPAPSARRRTASASPASRRTSPWSSSRAARTPATSSWSPAVNALTYAGDAGIDVVNMSFFVDPWLYNCTANPADTPGSAGRAAGDHRRDEPGAELRARPRRHPRRRARQQPRGSRQPAHRHHQPRLPDRAPHTRARSTTRPA